jgi:hypothetical protein
VCCVIVVLLCLSVFESLRIREIRKAWTSFGDVEVSVGVRSIWRAWTPGSTEESTCVVRFLDPLFLVTPKPCKNKCCIIKVKKKKISNIMHMKGVTCLLN